MIFLSGYIHGLVEADAGDVGFFDDGRVVRLVFGEGESEVLDAVLGAELHEEVGELSQLCGEPFYIVGRGDSAKQQYVVGEMGGSVRGCQDYERYCKRCSFGGKTGAIGVVLIAQFGGRSAVVVGEIFLDVGEGCSEAWVAYDRKAGRRLRFKGVLVTGVVLRPKMVFTRERSWLRLLDAFIFCWIWDLFAN